MAHLAKGIACIPILEGRPSIKQGLQFDLPRLAILTLARSVDLDPIAMANDGRTLPPTQPSVAPAQSDLLAIAADSTRSVNFLGSETLPSVWPRAPQPDSTAGELKEQAPCQFLGGSWRTLWH